MRLENREFELTLSHLMAPGPALHQRVDVLLQLYQITLDLYLTMTAGLAEA